MANIIVTALGKYEEVGWVASGMRNLEQEHEGRGEDVCELISATLSGEYDIKTVAC